MNLKEAKECVDKKLLIAVTFCDAPILGYGRSVEHQLGVDRIWFQPIIKRHEEWLERWQGIAHVRVATEEDKWVAIADAAGVASRDIYDVCDRVSSLERWRSCHPLKKRSLWQRIKALWGGEDD